MLVGVLADTHDNLPMIEQAAAALRARGAEVLLHAGDFISPFALKLLLRAGLPVIGVFGNNDGDREELTKIGVELFSSPHRFELAGRRVIMAHEPVVMWKALEEGDELAVCGHTHCAEVSAGPPLIVNPGEASGWLSGHATVAMVNLKDLSAEVVEFGMQERPQI